MPYLNVDDGFPDHPKVDALSDAAFRLHVSGKCYAARVLSDGIIPAARVPRLRPRYQAQQLNELLKADVWHKGGEGCDTETCLLGAPGQYVIHDYLEWNKSREWWEAERARKAKNKADWAARKRNQEGGES